MKIGIITLPFNSNYGGILQAYALQQVLKKSGHDVKNINRFSKDIGISFTRKILSFGNRSIKRYLLGIKVPVRIWPTAKEIKYMARHTEKFIYDNITLTHPLNGESEFSSLEKYGFDAYIVGSDQVWRPKYSPKIENHFLEFAKQQQVKKIAYAASFGVDKWEYTPEQTITCRQLAQKFNAISVREDAAVKLCRENLNIEVVQALDPTMLLGKEEYEELVRKDNLAARNQNLLIYILDITPRVEKIIQKVENEMNLKRFSTMPKNLFRFVGKEKIDSCISPPVTNWIKGFMDADFVITDSFHGTVFSIIFNKPFFTLGNPKRGMSRFISLLKIFELEERLITEDEPNIEEKLKHDIDFKKINKILETKKKEAISFLERTLKEP